MSKPYLIYNDLQKPSIEQVTNTMYILRGMVVYSSEINKYALPTECLNDPNYYDKKTILETLNIEYLSETDFIPK